MKRMSVFIALLVFIFVVDVSLIMIFINGTESWKFQTTDNSTYEIVKSRFIGENHKPSINKDNSNTAGSNVSDTDVKTVNIVIERLDIHVSEKDKDLLDALSDK